MSSDKPPHQLTANERREMRHRPQFTNHPSGKVVSPKRLSGKDRKAAKDTAAKMVESTCIGTEWMILGFRINPDSGDVQLAYKLCDFPHNAFEDAAGLFADLLIRLVGENPEAVKAILAAQAAQTPAQSSEVKPEANSITQ